MTPLERARLGAELARLVRAMGETAKSRSGALERAKLAAQIGKLLRGSGLTGNSVSIYTNGTSMPKEPDMTATPTPTPAPTPAPAPAVSLDTLQQQAAAALDATEPNQRGYRSVTLEAKLPDGRTIALVLTDQKPTGWRNRHSSIQRKAQWKLDGKVASKALLAELTGDRMRGDARNPLLRAAFEAEAPQLAADWEAMTRRVHDALFAKFDGRIPAYPRTNDDRLSMFEHMDIRMLLRPISDEHTSHSRRSEDWHLTLNEEKLKAAAVAYGDATAVDWFRKTSEKLGDLEDARLDREGSNRDELRITGRRNGREVHLYQQRVLKRSTRGVLFHQFPARLYVDSKFTPEAAYEKAIALTPHEEASKAAALQVADGIRFAQGGAYGPGSRIAALTKDGEDIPEGSSEGADEREAVMNALMAMGISDSKAGDLLPDLLRFARIDRSALPPA